MVNRVGKGVDTRVVVTDHNGDIECHIDDTGVEVAVAETVFETRQLAEELCTEFNISWRPNLDPDRVFRRLSSEVAARYNGI